MGKNGDCGRLMADAYCAKLKSLKTMVGEEIVHSQADTLLLSAIRELGYPEITDAWESVREKCGFYYA